MFHLVFFEPCIPQNTGNAIRLAANTGCELHLIEPLGFEMDTAKVRRAGLDYHDMARVTIHKNLDEFFEKVKPENTYTYTAHTKKWFSDIKYVPNDALIFGPETTGLPPEVIHDSRMTDNLRIPMMPVSRSLNLANSASIVLYEAWRQQGFPGAI